MEHHKAAPQMLPAEGLDQLIRALCQAGYRVLGPVLADQAIVYDEVSAAADLPQGWSDRQEKGFYRLTIRDDGAYFGYAVGPQSWKKYLHPPRQRLWHAEKTDTGFRMTAGGDDDGRPLALIGVRSCELHAIAIQDRVFTGSAFIDVEYQRRRQQLFTVAVNCTGAAPTCFCSSMHTGPAVTLEADLVLTEIVDSDRHYFLLRSGSDAGTDILAQLPAQPATAAEAAREQPAIDQAAEQMERGSRAFDSSDLRDLLYRNYDSPAWDQVAERCLSCANCTMACPTCFCSTVEDSTDLSGDHAERWQRWDSCFTGDFSHVHGGPIRASTRSRYRQWLTHKLATWVDQFDSSGCVGCGRCITWCPVGIDLTEEVRRIRDLEQP